MKELQWSEPGWWPVDMLPLRHQQEQWKPLLPRFSWRRGHLHCCLSPHALSFHGVLAIKASFDGRCSPLLERTLPGKLKPERVVRRTAAGHAEVGGDCRGSGDRAAGKRSKLKL